MFKKTLLAASAAALIGVYAIPAAHAQQSNSPNPVSSHTIDAFMQQWGTDHDGKLSLEEANKAAEARFAVLDTNHSGAVKETALVPAGISDKDLKSVDTDNDKLIQKSEYLNLVKQKFDAADTNHNNHLTNEQLNSQAGKALMYLLQ